MLSSTMFKIRNNKESATHGYFTSHYCSIQLINIVIQSSSIAWGYRYIFPRFQRDPVFVCSCIEKISTSASKVFHCMRFSQQAIRKHLKRFIWMENIFFETLVRICVTLDSIVIVRHKSCVRTTCGFYFHFSFCHFHKT